MKAPSRWWYLLVLVLPIAGCGASLAIGLSSVSDKVEAMNRVIVPGEASLTLRPGSYTGYYEARSFIDGKAFATGDTLTGLVCDMHSSSGTKIEIGAASSNTTYSLGSYSGVSLFDLSIPENGDYRFRCEYSDAHKTEPVVIAIGTGLAASIVMILIPAAVVSLTGLVLFLVVFRTRRKALRTANTTS